MRARLIWLGLRTCSRAFQTALSSNSLKGSRLNRILAANKTGSCGMIEIFFLRSFSGTVFVSTLSIVMVPSNGARWNSAAIRDDFPAPVLPTIPI